MLCLEKKNQAISFNFFFVSLYQNSFNDFDVQACMHEGDNDKGFILMNFSLIWVLFESASCISFVLTYVWVKCTKLFTFNQVMALGPTFSR